MSSSASFFLPNSPPVATPSFPVSATCTLQSVERSRTYYFDRRLAQLVVMDSDSVSTTAQLVIERGWIAPEAPSGDCVIREVWLHARWRGTHGAQILVAFDFDESAAGADKSPVLRTWSALEIASLVEDGRYTIGVNCQAKSARAVKVTVLETDASGSGMEPLTLTLPYGVSPGPRRRTMRRGALK